MPGEPVLISLFVLFALSFLSDKLLSRYLYMTAGLKPVDAQMYLWTRTEDNHMHRNRDRHDQLWAWMERRSGYAKEFYTMSRYCSLTNLPVKLYFVGVMVIFATRLYQYTWALGAAMLVLWAIFTLLGFRYGKYIQAETADFFDSSRYKPYRPKRESDQEEADTPEEPYEEIPYAGPFEAAEPEMAQRRRFRRGYTQKLFVVAVVLVFLVLPMLSSKLLLSSSTPEATTQPSEFPSAQPTSAGTPEAQAMYDRLEQEGFHPLNAVGQLSDTYPGIILSDGILVEEEGMHLEYLVLSQESQAKDLAQGLQHQLYELVAARDPDITEESGEGYTLYTQETEGDYGVVVRDGTNILYVYCPQYDTTWMKWFLNNLGYLSDH
ncbi:MAG TPA: hypothetical protein IAD31_06070 [Candidatus Enterenecus faecium]|uniref:Uncharacterized protein n=1 Tax=Candidatus Enterenecus faecium TaxID=2840780 RepID=A0A9D1CGY7_9FIRM|nr:hypothetical protein [Candidatus Enterenecus faecium]